LEPHGLQLDRRWMIVDQDGKFLSQRSVPQMARITVAIRPDSLLLEYTGQDAAESLEVPMTPPGGAPVTVKVWSDVVQANPYPSASNKVISQWLGTHCQLVKLPDPDSRIRTHKHILKPFSVSFADGAPVLMANRSTLDELAKQANRTLDMSSFRPNIVFGGCAAFAEDGWQRVWTPHVEFGGTWACTRCVMVDVDQKTGTTKQGIYSALAEVRRRMDPESKVTFGLNLVPSIAGPLRVGDLISAE
jgi:uncharacterized protein YcbX